MEDLLFGNQLGAHLNSFAAEMFGSAGTGTSFSRDPSESKVVWRMDLMNTTSGQTVSLKIVLKSSQGSRAAHRSEVRWKKGQSKLRQEIGKETAKSW